MITIYTGMGLNTDIEKGIFDRFRSMPVWRPAVLVGMLIADEVRYTAASLVVLVLGLKAQTAENVMQMSMTILFPLTFASNVFVDPSTMPGWVQAFVKVNPITHLTDASRALMHGTPIGSSSCGCCSGRLVSWPSSPPWRCGSTTPSGRPRSAQATSVAAAANCEL